MPARASKPHDRPQTPAGGLGDPRFSRALERGLAVLACFRPERRERGIADIAQELGLRRSTTHRNASTLQALGYLRQTPSRKYQVARRAADLGMAGLAGTGLRDGAEEHLRRLRDVCGYSASLAVLHDGYVLLIAHVRGCRAGQFSIEDGIAPGTRLPVGCTALGKLLLAYTPEREEIVTQLTLPRAGPRAITSKKLLRAELARARTDEITISDQELSACVLQIAAPIHDSTGTLHAAVAITAHTRSTTMHGLLKDHTGQLLDCAQAITHDLFGETSPASR